MLLVAASLALVTMALTATGGSARVAQVSSYDEPVDGPRSAIFPAIGVAESGRELVTWAAAAPNDSSDRRLWARYVGKDGRPDGTEFPISALSTDANRVYAWDSAIAARGKRDEFLVVWDQEPVGSGYRDEIVARRFDGRGNALSEQFTVSPPEDFASASDPEVVYDPKNRQFLVVWAGTISEGVSEIYASRIPAGASRALAPIAVSQHGTPTDQVGGRSPSVAYDTKRHRYLIGWSARFSDEYERQFSRRDVYARSLAVGARLSLGKRRQISGPTSAIRPGLAYSERADEYVAMWSAFGIEDLRVLGRRLLPSGRPIGERALIAEESWDAHAVNVEPRRRGGYLVAFQSNEIEGNGSTVYSVPVSATLEPGALARVATAEGSSRQPDLAYSDAKSRFRVAWIQGPDSPNDPYYNPNSPPQPPASPNVFVRSLSAPLRPHARAPSSR
ncbi:MAG: hypothetical protein ACRDJY_02340 [Thermoleophilaceae bacterium]